MSPSREALGRVAWMECGGDANAWDITSPAVRAKWLRVAEAVAAVVREECADLVQSRATEERDYSAAVAANPSRYHPGAEDRAIDRCTALHLAATAIRAGQPAGSVAVTAESAGSPTATFTPSAAEAAGWREQQARHSAEVADWLRPPAGQPVGEVEVPVPMVLHCPECRTRHVDVGEFATKPHHTHACQGCGLTWRPAVVATVGVQFLPGFRDAPPDEEMIERGMKVVDGLLAALGIRAGSTDAKEALAQVRADAEYRTDRAAEADTAAERRTLATVHERIARNRVDWRITCEEHDPSFAAGYRSALKDLALGLAAAFGHSWPGEPEGER